MRIEAASAIGARADAQVPMEGHLHADATATATAHAALAAAWATLDAGATHEAREIAQALLNTAIARDDLLLEARALSCLAHCDRVGTRLRRASDAGRRAAQLFKQIGDAEGEAQALATLAQVCMLLGRNDEAVEAALLCVKLHRHHVPRPEAVLAYDVLGLAYCWSGDHDRAEAALEAAVGIARRCDPGASDYQLRVDQMWVEASRLFDERYHSGSMADLTRFRELAHECRHLELAGRGVCVMASLQDMQRAVSAGTSALLEIWDGRPEAAQQAIDAARRSLTGAVTWLDALVSWCEAEQAWSKQDWPKAEQAAAEMLETALAVEHEQMACRAHLLLMQVYELQGKLDDVMRAQRALRRRERRVAAEGLASREAIVTWHLGLRRSEQHLRGALVQSRQFERWSLEDTLTGIANRRCFQLALEECLRVPAAAGRPLTVALLDVDKFKSINDTHTHRVGDRVLTTLATLMANNVRQHDLPARWAGDEFVILFQDASVDMAQQICGRIQAAIADFDWDSIAPGLRIAVSIGLSQAQPGDTAESLLHRSDKSMYSTKPRQRPAAPR